MTGGDVISSRPASPAVQTPPARTLSAHSVSSTEITLQAQALDADFARKLDHVLDAHIRALLPDDQHRWRQTTDADCAHQARESPLGPAREQMCKLVAYTVRCVQIRIL